MWPPDSPFLGEYGRPVSRSGRRREQFELAAELRGQGSRPAVIARTLCDRYGINARQALRTARGWTQADAAAEWNHRWPDDPKTFKNVSYWENWPGPTGHAPSLAVLERLAQLYGCNVADLVADWGTHGGGASQTAEPEALAWQVEHLDLPELTRAVADWGSRLPAERRRALLLKLATAASLAAGGAEPTTDPPRRFDAGTRSLAGRWQSSYLYSSTSRGGEFRGDHVVDLVLEDGHLVGRSVLQASGSELDLVLAADGSLLTGTWTERTSPSGHYRAATYHGVLQVVLDPTGHSMAGRWLGISKRYTIKSGEWRFDRAAPDTGPVTTATATDPGGISPAATMAKRANISLPT